MAGLISEILTQVSEPAQGSELPEWLSVKQRAARQALEELHAPNRKLENWRYSDASRLTLNGDEGPSLAREFEAKEGAEQVVVELHDGGFVVSENCPEWLQIKPVQQMAEQSWVDLELNQETVANLINVAAFNQGVCIEQLAGKKEAQIELVLVYNYKNHNQWQFIRNQIITHDDSTIDILEHWISGQINVTNVFVVGNNAQLSRRQQITVEQEQNFISFNQFELANKAKVKSFNQHSGGDLQHHIHRVNFNGFDAEFNMGTVNKTYNKTHIADIVEVRHLHENNQSDVTHRSIADNHSQIFTNAKALVAVGADQSEIEQDLKNILLSPDAKIFSKPELEVYADEVVAAHGSTIGALDEQSLFYLQSRGIDINQARTIMIESFEQEAMPC